VFEVRYGLAFLAAGKRRKALESAFDEVLEEELENRVLEVDAGSIPAEGRTGRGPEGHADRRHRHRQASHPRDA
jgi:hypothetical protein